MVLKRGFYGMVFASVMLCGGLAGAAGYRADEFLGMDLSRAVLSPKPLGPAESFVPRSQAAAPADGQRDRFAPTHVAAAKARPRIVVVTSKVAHLHSEPARNAARNRVAKHPGNPLDAQAFDTRIQVWPCKSGGICNWKRAN
jgi:hypothetical protein